MPGPVANGTNRITIVAHNASAIVTHLRHAPAKLCVTLTLVAIPPALRAWLSTKLNNSSRVPGHCHGGCFDLDAGASSQEAEDVDNKPKNLRLGHVNGLSGFWGGFIQIGMGFVVYRLCTGNGPEPCGPTSSRSSSSLYTLLAVFVFAATMRFWLVGAIAAIGNVAGEWSAPD